MTDIALAKERELPLSCDGDYDPDVKTGTHRFDGGGQAFLAHGVIGPEMRREPVWRRSSKFIAYGAEIGHPRTEGPPTERHHSDYENSEGEAVESAEAWQARCARESGMVDPIWRRD